jgi:rhodanese-related sulfurtransferase
MRAVLICLVLFFSTGAGAGELTWREIEREIGEKFPSAKDITVDQLKIKLKNKAPLVLVDVREYKEFQVSHIKGAVHLTRAEVIVHRYGAYAGAVVVYCSVGYRSGDMAVQLTKAGMKRVFNLKGSIFEWANRGNPVVNKQGVTRFVHYYNGYWGQLLQKKLHSHE